MTPYVPFVPTAKQVQFLGLEKSREVLYRGNGRTTALLMAALQYVHVHGYHAIVFAKTYKHLARTGGLIDISKQWLKATDAKWNSMENRWTFPSGASLEFAHMETEYSKYDYCGMCVQFVGYDDLDRFTEDMYTSLLGRLRKAPDGVHLRMRSTSSADPLPEWIARRFLCLPVIEASLDNNPFLNEECVAGLAKGV